VAEGDAGDKGRNEESEAFEAVDEASAVLPRAVPMAAGGREKCVVSKGPACALALAVMSVEGAGVGGKLGRGMMGRPAGALIGDGQGRGRGRGRGRGHRMERSVQRAVPGGDPDTATLETLRRAALSTVSRAVNGTCACGCGAQSAVFARPRSRLSAPTQPSLRAHASHSAQAVLLVPTRTTRTRRAPPARPTECWVHHSRHARPARRPRARVPVRRFRAAGKTCNAPAHATSHVPPRPECPGGGETFDMPRRGCRIRAYRHLARW
jgi:hypothetical protein